MGYNHFFPQNIGECQSLRTLGQAHNKLSGSIPKEIFLPQFTGAVFLIGKERSCEKRRQKSDSRYTIPIHSPPNQPKSTSK